MSYFYIPKQPDERKSHIVKPHTETTLCGWDEMDEKYKLSTDLRLTDVICLRCLSALIFSMDYEGTSVVSAHVFKTIVQQLEKRTKEGI